MVKAASIPVAFHYHTIEHRNEDFTKHTAIMKDTTFFPAPLHQLPGPLWLMSAAYQVFGFDVSHCPFAFVGSDGVVHSLGPLSTNEAWQSFHQMCESARGGNRSVDISINSAAAFTPPSASLHLIQNPFSPVGKRTGLEVLHAGANLEKGKSVHRAWSVGSESD